MESRMDGVELRVGGVEELIRKMMEQLTTINTSMNTMSTAITESAGRVDQKNDSDGENSPRRSTVISPNGEQQSFASQHRVERRKLEILVFNGDEVHGWLVQVDRYFRVNEVKEREKMDAMVVALEDRALN